MVSAPSNRSQDFVLPIRFAARVLAMVAACHSIGGEDNEEVEGSKEGVTPYFWVILTYHCPKGHGNQASRIYYEESLEAATAKARNSALVCYSPSHLASGTHWTDPILEIRPISESQFKEFKVGIGVDFSPPRF